MTEAATLSPHKAKALELACAQGGTHAEVVARANAYHDFLLGKTATIAAGAMKAEPNPAPAAAKAAAKDAAATKATPAAGTAPAAPKAPVAGAAPKATPKADAAKAPAAAAKAPAAGATTPNGDTKAPDGIYTYNDVIAALQSVNSLPKAAGEAKSALAYEILAKTGGGVKGVRDLKPTLYDAVVAACQEAVKQKPRPKTTAPTATVVMDDFGVPIDTSGASVETAGEDDQPESGSGEDV